MLVGQLRKLPSAVELMQPLMWREQSRACTEICSSGLDSVTCPSEPVAFTLTSAVPTPHVEAEMRAAQAELQRLQNLVASFQQAFQQYVNEGFGPQ